MAGSVVVRYKTKPDSADENERLIRRVFAELASRRPDGLRYTAFRLDDGVSFVHVAELDVDVNPLTELASFGEFQAGLADRCQELPTVAAATVIASYRDVAG